jgi:RimJ/RimL family protein N-acetyltransferase
MSGFDLQPHLVGDLLELRPLRPEDWEELFQAASDPLIWEQHPAHDRCKEEVFREFFRGAMESGGALVAIDRKTQAIIGSSRYAGFDAGQSEIEIGWTFLTRAYWGGKYNGEMKQLMLDHAFRFVETVIFSVGATNFRSLKAVQKIGGTLTDRRRHITMHGVPVEHILLQVKRPAR